MKTYFSIHNHSEYSNCRGFKDCINKIPEMVKYAKEIGLAGLFLTDHDFLAGAKDINVIAKTAYEENFKIGIGNEIYLTDSRERGQRFYHFLLMAKDEIGFRQLSELSSIAWYKSYTERGLVRTPTLRSELEAVVSKNPGHLMASSACLAGLLSVNSLKLSRARKSDNSVAEKEAYDTLVDFIVWCKDLFGEDFYIECAPNKFSGEQNEVNRMNYNIAKATNTKIVFATDSHYLRKGDRFIHKAFLQSDNKGEREVDSFYASSYMMTPQEAEDELSSSFSQEEIDEMAQNTLEIAAKVELYDLTKKQAVLKFPVPEVAKNYEDAEISKYEVLARLNNSKDEQERYWTRTCLNKLKEEGLWNDEYLSRIETEAEVIDFVGKDFGTVLFAYFNTLSHFINKIWEVNSIVGPSRGSACCFESNKLLGITQIDPIKNDLPYWRFLNKGSIGDVITTDIDIDLSPNSRNAFINEMKRELGEINAIAVGAYGTITTKSAVAVACKGYRSEEYPHGLDNDTSAYIASLVRQERGFLFPVKDELYGNEDKGRKPNVAFLQEVNKYDGLARIIEGVEGIIDKRTRHAAGVVISDDMVKYTPITRTPSGEITSAYSLYPLEDAGLIKYDMLVTDACAKISRCLELLQEHGYIDKNLSLREAYNQVLHPDIIDFKDERIWDKICSGKVLSLFQFNSNQGLIAIQKMQPRSLLELSASNATMRLMAEDGAEMPIDRYARFRDNIQLWYQEMREEYHLTEEDIKILEPYYLQYYGTISLQEDAMRLLMDERIAGFSLKEANAARKVISKKKMDKIQELHDKLFEMTPNKRLATYVWDTGLKPQMGYSFSAPHTLAYSVIAVQEALLTVKYPEVFWNCAVLDIEASTVEDVEFEETSDGADFLYEDLEIEDEDEEDEDGGEEIAKKSAVIKYDKVAKSLGEVLKAGIKVVPPYINSAQKDFAPNAEKNQIYYSLKALRGVGDDQIEAIMAARPFTSFADFMSKVKIKMPSIISLIKAGSFDEIEEDREALMKKYMLTLVPPKTTLNLRNYQMLLRCGYLPEELSTSRAAFEVTRYMKQPQFKIGDSYYICDERVQNFMSANYPDIFNELTQDKNGNMIISQKTWKKQYDKSMLPAKKYIADNLQELLTKVNYDAFQAEWQKRANGSISKWEMDSMNFYWHEHELAAVDRLRYNINLFSDLPFEPQVEKTFTTRDGKTLPLWKISKIMGTVIAKDNTKHIVTILDVDGTVVPIKLNKDYYALYNKQISEVVDGKKTVVEKSWFTTGNKIMVVGYRNGNNFMPKKYKTTLEKHRLMLITKINGEEIEYTYARKGQEEEI